MKALTIQALPGDVADFSGVAERLTAWRRQARRTVRRATTVVTVFILVGALHLMRWAGMILL